MHTRERRQLRLFIRRDTYGRYVSVPGLPAARPLQHHGPRADRRRSSSERLRRRVRRVHRPASASPTTARLHFVVRPPKGEPIARRRHRRPRAPARRGGPLLARRLHRRRDRRVRRGARRARWAGATPTSFPEAYKEDFPPRTAAVDLGRLEAIEGDEGIDLSLYEHARRRPRRGPAQGLPDRPAAVAVRGAADPVRRWASRSSTSGPTSSRASTATVVHLRLRAALRPAAARAGARELFQDALARGLGRLQRDRRLQRAGARRRADLAAGDGAARLREVHAPGRHAVRAGLHRGRAAQQRRHHPAAGRSCSRPGSTRRPATDAATDARRAPRSRRSRSGSAAPSTTWPASTRTGSCAPT